ncbi:MAG: hypothetical protein H0X47_04480 [Nitrospirales bacterium]|nr:hypothetical protein [Nitrospirales bacterium]
MSQAYPEYRRYLYCLRNVVVARPNQAWCVDITYVPMTLSFMCLGAILDWFSCYLVS